MSRFTDLTLVLFVLAIAAMLVVPLPTPLLDVLLVVNLSFSLLLLLVGIYVGNAATLYTFPTILLLSTLFRLGLNVASARLILSEGYAGKVIESFGTFLIRGELVVGLIIFSIVTVVNFIVISKGASRVSEVAARFALDSLPGKQTAIDNDARAGVLSAEEARRKRDDLRRESQLYGSMDGAMKFVQGDAIAGIVIIAANIVGGIFRGISSGGTIGDVIQTYTVLTVGDGLVTQIPSLLTAICAGMIVTRVTASDASSLSHDVREQFFSQPPIIFATGGILLLFALMPGVPLAPFLSVALCVFAVGLLVRRGRLGEGRGSAGGVDASRVGGVPALSHSVRELDFHDDHLTVWLDPEMLFRAYRGKTTLYLSRWQEIRRSFHDDTGVLLPELSVNSDPLLMAGAYRVSCRGVQIIQGTIVPDARLVEVGAAHAPMIGLSVIAEESHPVSGTRVFWTLDSVAVQKMMEAASIPTYDFFEYIALKVSAFAVRYPEEFLSATDVHALMRGVEKRHPGLIADGFGKDYVSVATLTEILHELVRQGVSIRDFRGILEGVASFCASREMNEGTAHGGLVAPAVDHIKLLRRRQIVQRFLGSASSLRVVAISEDVQNVLADASLDRAGYPLGLDEETAVSLSVGLEFALKVPLEVGIMPLLLLCPSELKEKITYLVRRLYHPIQVIGLEDIDPSIAVEQVGMWGLAKT